MTRPARGRRTAAPDVRALVTEAAAEATGRKARDVTLLELRGLTSATDWFLLASGESDVQVRSIAERIQEFLRTEHGIKPWHVEGLQHARWVLLDYVDFVIHVFHRETRDYYQLERLWADAPSESFPAAPPEGAEGA